MNIILEGVVGSTAYGLDTPDSDIDRLGIFLAPTISFLGLDNPKQSVVSTNPDSTHHELKKWCELALKCNPTVMELVWLPDEFIETITPLGAELRDIRELFLSKGYVRNAYFGYAFKQFEKLTKRNDGTFSSDLRKRTAKHARHLLRLLSQGEELYATGKLNVRVPAEERQRYFDFGNAVANGNHDAALRRLEKSREFFDTRSTPLPSEPNRSVINLWLREARVNEL